jgi:hypothetical protein
VRVRIPRNPPAARVSLAERADEPTSRSAGERCEVLVHVDAAMLTGGEDADVPHRPAPCHLDGGAALAVETVRRLCCDAGIVPVVRDGDRTLAVGRRTRSIPPAIRRALQVRRPGCAFPGCERVGWLDAHHLVHWAHGGRTELDNLVHLCRGHHRLVHEGGWTIALDRSGRCTVRSPDGRVLTELAATTAAPSPVTPAPTAVADAADALLPLSAGQRYDLDLAVDALVAWTRPPEPPAGCPGADHPLAA